MRYSSRFDATRALTRTGRQVRPGHVISRRALLSATAALSLGHLPLSVSGTQHVFPDRMVALAAEGEYRDPAGRFSVPIPPNWTVEENDAYVLLRAPDGDLNVVIGVFMADDAGAGIISLWRILDSTFDPASPNPDRAEVPSDLGIDQTVVVTYDLGQTTGRIAQGLGFRVAGQVYVLIFRGDLQTAVRRQSQINVIVSGFRILGGVSTDLTGQVPLALDGARLSAFENFVQTALTSFHVPGAAIAVVRDDMLVYARGFGVTDVHSRLPVSPDTMMMAGSITKSLTTMLMGALVDAGRFAWDEPVVKILPSFSVADPTITSNVTVKNLVCACTGVPRRDAEIYFNADYLTAEDVIASLAGFTFYTRIGEAFQYSNQMVAAGGYIAALADGARYGDLYSGYVARMKRRILDPIGMTKSTFDISKVIAGSDYATPHGVTLSGMYQPLPIDSEGWTRPIAPAAGIWTTANEMARYVRTLLRYGVAPTGERIVSQSNLEATWTPQVAVAADTSYGLGWFIERWNGLKLISHGGNTNGFTGEVAFLPEAGLGVVILTNAQVANPVLRCIRQRLLEIVYDQEDASTRQLQEDRRAAEESRAALQQQVGLAVTPTEGRSLSGSYHNNALGDVSVSYVDGRLVADAGEFRVALQPLVSSSRTVHTFIVVDPPFAGQLVHFDTAGQTPQLIYGEKPEEYTFGRSPEPSPTTFQFVTNIF